MLYYEIKDNIITGIYSGDMPKEKQADVEYFIVKQIHVNVGDDVRLYSDVSAGIKKLLKQLVTEGLISIPEGKKLNEHGTDFIDMTEAEKVAAGLIQLKADEKIEGDYIVKKTEKEQYEAGLISKTAYNTFVDQQRQAAYKREADPLGMQVMRGEVKKTEWLAKIDEIKKRYPKVE